MHQSLDRETFQALLKYADPNCVFQDGSTAWSRLLKKSEFERLVDITKNFLNAGENPRHMFPGDPKIKSQMPEDLKLLLEQRRDGVNRLKHYLGRSWTDRCLDRHNLELSGQAHIVHTMSIGRLTMYN